MLRRCVVVALVAAQVACGAGAGTAEATPSPKATCNPLQVNAEQYTLSTSTEPTSGFDLRAGTQPVGIIADRDGSSVWLLGTGSDSVIHVTAVGAATAYKLPQSGLGIQMSQAADGTVWVPEQHRDAIASIAPDGTVRECKLPGTSREPQATAIAADGSVWVSEGRGGAIAHLVGDRFMEFPIGIAGAQGAEVLVSRKGGAWFTTFHAPVLGHITDEGQIATVPIGGSGTNLGVLEASDGSVYVADFDGDRVVRVGADGHTVTEWKTANRASPQGLALAAGGVLWLTESRANKIARIRGGKLQEVYQTGQWPDHIAITADGFGWFTEYYQDRLGRLKLPTA
jgi:virginiamycin B lyase